MKTTTRRNVIASMSGGGLLSALPLNRPAWAQSAPIRLGCVSSLSGAQEILGRPILVGAQIAAAQINAQGGVLGRPIEIVERDDRADPNQALTVARELIGNGVNLLFGVITSPAALALTAIMVPQNGVLMICAAATDKINHEAFEKQTFRVSDSTHMRMHGQARVAAEHFPNVTKWGAIIPDVEFGRAALASFDDGIATAYPKYAGKPAVMAPPLLTRFGASDYKTQLSTLAGMDIEGLFNSVYGGDAVTMLQQARPYGLLRKLKMISDTGAEYYIPKALGKSTPPTLWTGMHWYYGAYQDIPLGKQLYDDYVKKTGDRYPVGFVNEGHSAVLAYAAAIKLAGTNESKAVTAALEGLTFNTAKGPVTLRREDHQAVCDMNWVRFEPIDEEPGWKVAEYVKYGGAEFMEPPTPGVQLAYRSRG